MPLSAAEKMKKRREKLRTEGKYEDYREEHREACKKSRAKKKARILEMPEAKRKALRKLEREKVKERVSKCRRLKLQILTKEAEDTDKEMNLRTVFDNPPAIPGISKIHLIYWQGNILQTAHISSDLQMGIKLKSSTSFYEKVYGQSSESDYSSDDILLLVNATSRVRSSAK